MTRLRIRRKNRRVTAEAGVALLVSLFALMLICVVGIALIMASGTDTALTGNYRSSTSVYYAALAGLEEARGRLLTKAPNNSGLDIALGLPPGTLPGIGPASAQVWYIVNPLPGETVTPWDTSPASLYPDNEFAQEFPGITANVQQPINSISSQQNSMYTMYKWVRINAITATSEANIGVTVNQGGPQNSALLYAGGHLFNDPAAAGPEAVQAVEITSLAAMQMPNGTLSQRMLQYVVAPTTFFNVPNAPNPPNIPFPAALTLDGVNVVFNGPPNQLAVNGTDLVNLGACAHGNSLLPGIGYTNGPMANSSNMSGSVLPAADVTASPVLPSTWLTPGGLDSVAQTVTQNADVSFSGNTDGSVFPPQMGMANPMAIAVDGNLDLSTWSNTGYGVLLVTGTLFLNSNANWNGVVLVIGQGQVMANAGSGLMNGAVFLAQTRTVPDAPLLPQLGAASWTQVAAGQGINYSSCWINFVQTPYSFKVLSFREIPLS